MTSRRPALRCRIGALLVVAATVATACGSKSPREFTGYRREPAPLVGDLALPDLSNPGSDLSFVAEQDHLLVVYFGYTNCPDFCPTTLSDLRLATRRMDEGAAARIDVAMVTVDPQRDIEILPDYITSFFDNGHALGTNDASLLATAAAPFGASYNVDQAGDGTVDVAHTTSLYVIDDTGHLALTWQFGVSIDDLAADLTQLLDSSST